MAQIYYRFGLNDKYANPKGPLLFGMECEIESLDLENVYLPDGISMIEDGSLRNNGHEFLSIPSDLDTSIKLFERLHTSLRFFNPDGAFSERTSTHVHVNCKGLDEDVVRNIILWYALFEECFFKLVDPSRRDNIHCVPLTDTVLPSAYYRAALTTMHSRWSKYTALNILPLSKLGTIEFRHMQGTRDVSLMKEWLQSISNLFELGKTTKLMDTELSEKNVQQRYMEVFGGTRVFTQFPIVGPLVEDSLIDVKMGLL
jgi:hypothetical protein